MLRNVIGASVILLLLTWFASQFAAELPQMSGAQRSLPRMRPAPTNVSDFLRALGVGSLLWYACFSSAPFFLLASRAWPIRRKRWPAAVLVHVAFVLVLATVTALGQYQLSYHGVSNVPPASEYVKGATLAMALPFLTVATFTHALEAGARAQQRSLDAERVRSQLAESRLAALTAQLQPHFLFNTLQGISTLITHDPVGADAMLASLSDLLRDVLRRGDEREVEVREELRVLESYLDISRRRFGDRLTVIVQTDEMVLRALLPFFILQPLVENALHHGISSHAGAGRIEIRVHREGEHLMLLVTDDGPGIVTSDNRRGIGLTNTRERLHELYGASCTMASTHPNDGGFRVTIALPYHERESSTGNNS